MQVGFVGLGAMGLPMAANLLEAGHKLRVFDINESSVELAVQKGAVRTGAVRPRTARSHAGDGT